MHVLHVLLILDDPVVDFNTNLFVSIRTACTMNHMPLKQQKESSMKKLKGTKCTDKMCKEWKLTVLRDVR